jgi:tetratricopeptide (TPR) repeat protein
VSRTHYDTLGVSPKSTANEIRSAYRKLVLRHHPDQSSDPKSADILMEVVKAYEVLNDPIQRKRYDAIFEPMKPRVEPKPKPAPPPEKPAEKPKPKQNPLTEQILRLSSLYNKGRFSEAEKLAVVILEQNPREPTPYGVLGDIARARGQLGQAINMYAHAVQADPRNQLYQQRYEELVKLSTGSMVPAEGGSTVGQQSAMALGVGVCIVSFVYIALGREAPLMPGLGLVSSWTLGLIVMLFLCGVTTGVALSLGGKLDRFTSVSTTSTGRVAPAMALGTVAMVSFWAAAVLYAIIGLSQNAFNFSTSRLIGAVAGVVSLSTLAAMISQQLNPMQVFLWGGNLTYVGAICGWMITDSFSRVV